jgi:hypothetical protein
MCSTPLEERWAAALDVLSDLERAKLVAWVPGLRAVGRARAVGFIGQDAEESGR